MGYMKQVAEMLGVEIGERFALESYGNKIGDFKFEKDGLYSFCNNGPRRVNNDSIALLLAGDLDIVKKPWLPETGDKYYVLCHTYVNMAGAMEQDVLTGAWCDSTADIALYATGNCFRTEEEAEAAKPWYEENIKRMKRGEPWKARE